MNVGHLLAPHRAQSRRSFGRRAPKATAENRRRWPKCTRRRENGQPVAERSLILFAESLGNPRACTASECLGILLITMMRNVVGEHELRHSFWNVVRGGSHLQQKYCKQHCEVTMT
jgi:hypothetical protein